MFTTAILLTTVALVAADMHGEGAHDHGGKCRHLNWGAINSAAQFCKRANYVREELGGETLFTPLTGADEESKVDTVREKCASAADGAKERLSKFKTAAEAKLGELNTNIKADLGKLKTRIETAQKADCMSDNTAPKCRAFAQITAGAQITGKLGESNKLLADIITKFANGELTAEQRTRLQAKAMELQANFMVGGKAGFGDLGGSGMVGGNILGGMGGMGGGMAGGDILGGGLRPGGNNGKRQLRAGANAMLAGRVDAAQAQMLRAKFQLDANSQKQFDGIRTNCALVALRFCTEEANKDNETCKACKAAGLKLQVLQKATDIRLKSALAVGKFAKTIEARAEKVKGRCQAAAMKAKKCVKAIKGDSEVNFSAAAKRVRDEVQACKPHLQVVKDSECVAKFKAASTEDERATIRAECKTELSANADLVECIKKFKAAKVAAEAKFEEAKERVKDEPACGIAVARKCKRAAKIYKFKVNRRNGCPASDEEAIDLAVGTLKEKCIAKFDEEKCQALFKAARFCGARESEEEAAADAENLSPDDAEEAAERKRAVAEDELTAEAAGEVTAESQQLNCRRAKGELHVSADFEADGKKRAVLDAWLEGDDFEGFEATMADGSGEAEITVTETADDDESAAADAALFLEAGSTTGTSTDPVNDTTSANVLSLSLAVVFTALIAF